MWHIFFHVSFFIQFCNISGFNTTASSAKACTRFFCSWGPQNFSQFCGYGWQVATTVGKSNSTQEKEITFTNFWTDSNWIYQKCVYTECNCCSTNPGDVWSSCNESFASFNIYSWGAKTKSSTDVKACWNTETYITDTMQHVSQHNISFDKAFT